MQVFLTITTIALALIYLGRQFYIRFFTKDTKCDGCAHSKTARD